MFIGDSHLDNLRNSEHFQQLHGHRTFLTRRGGGIAFLESAVYIVENSFSRPDVAVVFIGGNDMDSPRLDIANMAHRYATALDRLSSLGIKVLFMRIWPRFRTRHALVDYATNTNYFEHLLAENLGDRVKIWAWDRTMRFTYTFFRDGVHCRRRHERKVCRYLRTAALAGVRWVRRDRT